MIVRIFGLFLVALFAFESFADNDAVVIWSGGFGVDERAEAPSEGVKFVFALTSGHFLAGIDVSVKQQSGQEIAVVEDTGPWLILDLPVGDYDVIAVSASGETQSARIRIVGDSSTEFGFAFQAE